MFNTLHAVGVFVCVLSAMTAYYKFIFFINSRYLYSTSGRAVSGGVKLSASKKLFAIAYCIAFGLKLLCGGLFTVLVCLL